MVKTPSKSSVLSLLKRKAAEAPGSCSRFSGLNNEAVEMLRQADAR